MAKTLRPPMQKGKEPPFYEMGALPFQELCRDLVAVQDDFIDCRVGRCVVTYVMCVYTG